jgi:hypothetical protein
MFGKLSESDVILMGVLFRSAAISVVGCDSMMVMAYLVSHRSMEAGVRVPVPWKQTDGFPHYVATETTPESIGRCLGLPIDRVAECLRQLHLIGWAKRHADDLFLVGEVQDGYGSTETYARRDLLELDRLRKFEPPDRSELEIVADWYGTMTDREAGR